LFKKYFGGIVIKKILIFLLLLYSINIYGSDNWRQVTAATYNALNDVYFLNENIGWIAGTDGTILRTTDGGYTWEEPTSPLPVIESMYSIYFINENIGYAGGNYDLLLKTIDGGKTWSEVTFPSSGGKVYSLYFTDENSGWVLSGTSSGGKIYYTDNGGVNWSLQASETSVNLKAMNFNSPGHGICVGGRKGNFAIYYTTDGSTWTKAPNPTGIPNIYSRTDLYAVAMASDDVACVTGWGSTFQLQPSYTMRTTDGGANWTYETQAEEERLYNSMYGMSFIDELTGIAVGGSTYKGGVAYKTTDGGLTWKENNFPMGFVADAISMINDKICIVGSSGGIAISKDSGETWQLITQFPNSELYVLEKIGGNTLATAGYGGIFMKSIDDGETWETTYIADKNVCPTVEDLCFLDENIGYAAQNNRAVSKTIDGGKTWTQIMKDTIATSINNNGVQFIDQNIGFVVGKGDNYVSAFYKTTDGGTNWSALIGDPNLINELNTLHFFNENNGVVAGDESSLAYTTNGGSSWTKVTPSGIPTGQFDYNRIKFLNETFGLAVGEKLIKSTDAGKTWQYVEVAGLPGTIEGVDIVDELTWYITGSKYLFKTSDGGLSWSNIIDLEIVTASTNYDVQVDENGFPLIVCGDSEIYTSAPVVISVEITANDRLDSFVLEANYPNPFNPSTKIQYSIPVANGYDGALTNVILKVYDVLGQEVATLVNEAQKSGTYEVSFDASSLNRRITTGIYIYRIQANEFVDTKKMMLIK